MEEDAVSKFIAVLKSTPVEIQNELLSDCCFALGIQLEPCKVVTFDDLQARMRMLTEQTGVSEELLVPGLFRYLVEHFVSKVEESLQLEARDPLGAIGTMSENRVLLPDDVRKLLSDEFIQGMIDNAKEVIRDFHSHREDCQRTADTVRAIWNTQFPREYWLEWRKTRPSPDY